MPDSPLSTDRSNTADDNGIMNETSAAQSAEVRPTIWIDAPVARIAKASYDVVEPAGFGDHDTGQLRDEVEIGQSLDEVIIRSDDASLDLRLQRKLHLPRVASTVTFVLLKKIGPHDHEEAESRARHGHIDPIARRKKAKAVGADSVHDAKAVFLTL
ncbi:uncharacterized protein BKA78DRAFT_353189 [Phyllosticta capitalensis]|uniref:uncharacterized protein n=1 Tax=Phyllosticta capitalensis TaxID=121624 RepID=UPI0031323815